MSKDPFTAEHRFYLWLAILIIGGVLGFVYVIKH